MQFIKQNRKKLIFVIALLFLALFSMFGISKSATDPQNYKSIIQSIDDKKGTVMSVTAGAAATSTLLSLVPGDATTPIANQIMQISSYLIIVVCVLVLEKSLLTITGYLSFNILIPIACGLLSIYKFYKKDFLRNLALKFIAFSMVIVMIVPLSLKIGDMICAVNATVIEQVSENIDEIKTENTDGEEHSLIDKIIAKISNDVSETGDYAKRKLNQIIDAVAVFIIAYCVIPILVVIFVVWLIKILFEIKIPIGLHKQIKEQ